VSVHVQKEDETQVTVEFAVSDTGIGIEEIKLKNIFENFQQASSETSRIYGGTGLGLAIVKQLVEAQGGSIYVNSKPDEGSTFRFTLNFQKTNAKADIETELAGVDAEIKNAKILVVEDIALNQLLMRTLLEDFGFECDIAPNGRIAIEKLLAGTYDIILMDLQMPEMNGFETTEHIRNKMFLSTPIIALTADVTTSDLARCKAVGMNDYISKPVDERLLYTKLVLYLKKPILAEKESPSIGSTPRKKAPFTNLEYLKERTKSNPKLVSEMIALYLEQTTSLTATINDSLQKKDWPALKSAAHKLIPSFAIVGLSKDHENLATKIQEYTSTQQHMEEIPGLVAQLTVVLTHACNELEAVQTEVKNTH
jgi:CheY-like chemotaxis protein